MTWLSVIIPTYNGSRYLGAALDSIKRQGRNDIEVIIVDDGSTDDTLYIAHSYTDQINLKIIRNGRVGNWVKGTNLGLSIATGEFATFLHQDDIWAPERIKYIAAAIQRHNGINIVFHPVEYINYLSTKVGTWNCPFNLPSEILSPDQTIPKLFVSNFISISAPFFRRSLAVGLGGLDETMWFTADWKFWIELFATGPALFIPRPLSSFRIHHDSLTVTGTTRLESTAKQLALVLDQMEPKLRVIRPDCDRYVRMARFGMHLNVALTAAFHKSLPYFFIHIAKAMTYLPVNVYRYFYISRLHERILARLRTLLTRGSPRPPRLGKSK
ncbi:MAG: glycosyltransferase [Oligoflexia bacterium]|nr:glycosyltransferase [Oligoflexia bacterium]